MLNTINVNKIAFNKGLRKEKRKLLKRYNVQAIIKWTGWKSNAYLHYSREDYANVNLVFILREIFDGRFREQNYKNYKKFQILKMESEIGVKMCEGTSLDSFREVFIDRIYSMYSDFIPSEKDVVLDIGAQHGDYAILCSKFFHCKKVYSFEPLPNNAEIFRNNLIANNVKNVDFFPTAISDKDGSLKIYYEGDMLKKSQIGKELIIETKRIDSLDLQSCTFIKIDVEGFELEVLGGALNVIRKYKPKLIIETHSLSLRKKTEEFLSQFGYTISHEGRGTWVNENGMDYVQNLFFS